MKTIKHISGVSVYARVKNNIKERMQERYIIPQNEPYLYYDSNKDIVFVQKPNEFRVVCTLRKGAIIDNFHNYSNKQS